MTLISVINFLAITYFSLFALVILFLWFDGAFKVSTNGEDEAYYEENND